jgi:hypothetical protein
MYHPDQINRKHILFFIVAGMILLSIILVIAIISITTEKKQGPSPSPIHTAPTAVIIEQNVLSPLQKTAVGSAFPAGLESRPDFLSKQTLPTGGIEYSFQSEIDARPATIVTDKNGTVIFERILTPEEPDATGYTLISDFKNKYGEPDRDIGGSHFYEWAIHTYIYASKGFALVGNPNTDEVFEIHNFQPMTVDEYITKFGEDLDPGAEHQPETWEDTGLDITETTPAL